MGYTAAGGPKGLGQFNNTPQTVADLNKLRDLIAERGNYMGSLTEGERDAIPSATEYAGLLIFNSTTNQLEMYDGSGWSVPGDTGWVDITTMGTGWQIPADSSLIPQIRKIGDQVQLRGLLFTSAGVTFTNLCTVPAGFAPSKGTWYAYTRVSSGGSFHGMLQISAAGVIALPSGYREGSFAVGQYLPISGSYMR